MPLFLGGDKDDGFDDGNTSADVVVGAFLFRIILWQFVDFSDPDFPNLFLLNLRMKMVDELIAL